MTTKNSTPAVESGHDAPSATWRDYNDRLAATVGAVDALMTRRADVAHTCTPSTARRRLAASMSSAARR